jgi:hypothetical protein
VMLVLVLHVAPALRWLVATALAKLRE